MCIRFINNPNLIILNFPSLIVFIRKAFFMINVNDISPIKITENIKSWILSAYLIIEGFSLYLMYSTFMDTQILLQLKLILLGVYFVLLAIPTIKMILDFNKNLSWKSIFIHCCILVIAIILLLLWFFRYLSY